VRFITPRSGVRVSPPLPIFSLRCNVYGHAATASRKAVAVICRNSYDPSPALPHGSLSFEAGVRRPVSNGRGRKLARVENGLTRIFLTGAIDVESLLAG
jgi:hypothetical protein